MTKNAIFGLSVLLIGIGCSKKTNNSSTEISYVEKKYDTVAIDSFSNGATSVNIAKKIRMSSVTYKDSLKKVMEIQTAEKKKKEEQDKLEKMAKQEIEKEKAKEKEKSQTTSSTTTN